MKYSISDRVIITDDNSEGEILVIDVGGYIGNSTKSEIEYAQWNNKNIRYLSKE